MYKLGLIGFPLSHSFSKKYFDLKFKNEHIINFTYSLYELSELNQFHKLINDKHIIGLNITSPYKNKIINHLSKLDKIAQNTKSVNTVFINPLNHKTTGFNTDYIGFQELIPKNGLDLYKKALILGSGGVSKTVSYILKEKNIEHFIASRFPKGDMIEYQQIHNIMNEVQMVINTTPVGQYPRIEFCPNLPYNLISKHHICIDLIYNPVKTYFLKKAQNQGATIINGKKMLIRQAEESWKIWNELI